VAVPSYAREDVTVGIVHFGVGGFHRAHQAMYLDRLMNDGQALDWGICGVGVMPFDERMRDALDRQDGLYTLVLKAPDGSRDARVVGSIIRYLYAPDSPEAVLEMMADPDVRIVSLTVTEGGYNIGPRHRRVRRDQPRRRPRRAGRGGTADHVRLRHRGARPPPRPGHPAVHRQLL